MEHEIRKVLALQGKLGIDVDELDLDDDLFSAGLTSHASVNVMLGLEDEFDIEFPDEALNKTTFSSIRSLCDAVGKLVDEAA